MIDVSRINEKRIKIDMNLLKLSIIIIRIIVVKNTFRKSHHLFRLLHSKTY